MWCWRTPPARSLTRLKQETVGAARLAKPTAPVMKVKPVTLDYDSDDARLIELKQEGRSDMYIAKVLSEEGPHHVRSQDHRHTLCTSPQEARRC